MAKMSKEDVQLLAELNQKKADGIKLTDEQIAKQKALQKEYASSAAALKDAADAAQTQVDAIKASAQFAAQNNQAATNALQLNKAINDAKIAELQYNREIGVVTEAQYQKEKAILALKDEANAKQQKLHNKTKDTVSALTGINAGWKDTFVGSLVESTDRVGVLGGALKEAANINNVFGSTMMKVQEATIAVFKATDQALSSLNKQTGAAGALDDATFSAFEATNHLGVGMDDAAATAGALHQSMSGFAQLGKATQAEMIGAAASLQAVGISGATAGKTLADMQTGLGMSTKEAIATQKSMAAAAISIGMAPSEMAEGFNKAMPTLAAYGKQAPQIFKKVAAAAKGLNVSIDTLLGMTQEMDTFEGAAKAAGKLNSVLGGPLLNSMDLLNATEDERIRMVLQSVEASGKSWASMGKFERKAVAAAAGITDMNEANKMFSGGLSAYDDMSTKMGESAEEQKKLEEAQAAGVSITEKMEAIFNQFAMAVMPLVDGVRWLMDGILTLNNATGGMLVPTIVGFISIMWALSAATKVAAMWQSIKTTRDMIATGVTKTKTLVTNLSSASVNRETIANNAASLAEKARAGATAVLTAAKNSTIIASMKNAAITGWELTKTVALTTWSWALSAAKWALGGAAAFLGISLGGQATGQAAAAATSAPAAAGTAAMGTAAWFAVIPVGLLAIGIGLLAIGIGLVAIAIAAVVWAFVYLIKLFMEAPMAAVQAAGAIALMGVALGVLAIGLALVTVVAIPAAIALVLLGAASLIAGAGFIVLGVGMMLLAGGVALLAASAGDGDPTFAWLPMMALNLLMAAVPLLIAGPLLMIAGMFLMLAGPMIAFGMFFLAPALMALGEAMAVIAPFVGAMLPLAAALVAIGLAAIPFAIGMLILGIIASLPFFSTGIEVLGDALTMFGEAMAGIPTEKAVALGQIFAGISQLGDIKGTAKGLKAFGWALFPLALGLSALPAADTFAALAAGLQLFGEVAKEYLLPVGLALAAIAPLLFVAAPMLWFAGMLIGPALYLLGGGLYWLAIGLFMIAPVLPVMAAVADLTSGIFPFALALALSGPLLLTAALWFLPAAILLNAAAWLLLPAMFMLGLMLPVFAFGLMFLVPLIPFMIILGMALKVLGDGFIQLGIGINMLWDKVGGFWSDWYDFTWNLYYGLRRIGWGARYLADSKEGINATADLFKVLNTLNTELPHQIHMIALAIEHLAMSMQQLPLTKTIALTATLDAFEGAVHAAIKMKSEAPDGDLGSKGEGAASGARKAKSRASKGMFGGVSDAISSMFGASGGGAAGGSGNDVVLVLNNRELGRAIDAHLAKKHNLTIG